MDKGRSSPHLPIHNEAEEAPAFKIIEKIVNECDSQNNCDHCSVKLQLNCRKLWDKYASRLDFDQDLLEKVLTRFNEIRAQKKGEDLRG